MKLRKRKLLNGNESKVPRITDCQEIDLRELNQKSNVLNYVVTQASTMQTGQRKANKFEIKKFGAKQDA